MDKLPAAFTDPVLKFTGDAATSSAEINGKIQSRRPGPAIGERSDLVARFFFFFHQSVGRRTPKSSDFHPDVIGLIRIELCTPNERPYTIVVFSNRPAGWGDITLNGPSTPRRAAPLIIVFRYSCRTPDWETRLLSRTETPRERRGVISQKFPPLPSPLTPPTKDAPIRARRSGDRKRNRRIYDYYNIRVQDEQYNYFPFIRPDGPRLLFRAPA